MTKKRSQKVLGACISVALAVSSSMMGALPAFAAVPSSQAVAQGAIADTVRLGGTDRYETAAKIAQAGWPTLSEYAVLASGEDAHLVDALTAAPLAKLKNAPILLTQGDQLNPYTEQELKRLKVSKVYVTSGTGVISQVVLSQLSDLGIQVAQLGGSDRFETSLNIAKQLGTPARVIVTTAWNNADALSVASLAAAKGYPILLSDTDKVPAPVLAYVSGVKDALKKTYVLGGQGALSDHVLNALPNATRLGGEDRYGTNLEILKAFAQEINYRQLFVANGTDAHLVDALAGAPYAALTGSATVLTDTTLPAATADYAKLNLSTTIRALGGEAVVSSDTVNALAAATVYAEAGSTQGSSDPTKPVVLNDKIKVMADHVTLQNATANFSIYVGGNNATLSNVTVNGTVFLDPGSNGTATLDHVTAKNIVVLSGASNSIVLKNVTADRLNVQSSSQVHVESVGTTRFTSTVVTSNAILDAQAGSFGAVEVGQSLDPNAVVEFKGTFATVTVTGAIAIKNSGSATFTQLVVTPEKASDAITLEGHFEDVVANGNVILGQGTVITTLMQNGNAQVVVGANASITTLIANGDIQLVLDITATVSTVSGSGQVQASGDGAGNVGTAPGNSGGVVVVTTPQIMSLTNLNNVSIATISGSTVTLAPSAMAFFQPRIKVNEDSTLNMKVTRGVQTYDLGTWSLNGSNVNNDLLSQTNLGSMNILGTLNALKASNVPSSTIFNYINFHSLLTAIQQSNNQSGVYTGLASMFNAVKNDSSAGAFYSALNLPGIYTAADASTRGVISTVLQNALTQSGIISSVTAANLLDPTTSAAALATLNAANQWNAFFTNINFTQLFDALSASTQKDAIYKAINFTDVYTALATASSTAKVAAYAGFAQIYAAVINSASAVDAANAINFGGLLTPLLTSPNSVQMTLIDASGHQATYSLTLGN